MGSCRSGPFADRHSKNARGLISIEHPLLQKLIEANVVAAERFPAKYDAGFGSLGLILTEKLETSYYPCTPATY